MVELKGQLKKKKKKKKKKGIIVKIKWRGEGVTNLKNFWNKSVFWVIRIYSGN